MNSDTISDYSDAIGDGITDGIFGTGPICELFAVECDQFGFSVTADEDCRASHFGHLPDQYAGMFASGMESQEDLTNCFFSPDGSVNFRFDECGTTARLGIK